MNNSIMLITYFVTYVPIIVIFAIMPYIVRKNVFFGVTAPSDFYSSNTAKSMRKTYTTKVIVFGFAISCLSIFSTFLVNEEMQAVLVTVSMFVLLFVIATIYYGMYKKAKNLKEELKWDSETEATVVTDTSFFTKKITVTKWWFVIYGIIVLATIALGIILYDKMPNQVPMRTDMNGNITYAAKSYKLIFNMPIIQIIISAIFIFVFYTLRVVRPEIDSNQIEKTIEQNRAHRYAWSCFTMFSGIALLLVFLLIQLQILGLIGLTVSIISSLAIAVLILIAAVILAVKFGQSGSKIKTVQEGNSSKTIDRKDDKYWRMGMYYVNKDDPSLFVEKRFGVGYTLNFGRPLGWIVLGAIVIIVIVSIIISK